MTSMLSVQNPCASRKRLRTDYEQCTNSEQLPKITGMAITANDVVREFLQRNLIDTGRVGSKSELAEWMETSRTQVYSALKTGNIEMDHLTHLAERLGVTIGGLFGELAAVAKQLEKRPKAQKAETTLPGRRDRKLFSSDSSSDELLDEERRARGEPSEPSEPRPKHHSQSPQTRR